MSKNQQLKPYEIYNKNCYDLNELDNNSIHESRFITNYHLLCHEIA